MQYRYFSPKNRHHYVIEAHLQHLRFQPIESYVKIAWKRDRMQGQFCVRCNRLDCSYLDPLKIMALERIPAQTSLFYRLNPLTKALFIYSTRLHNARPLNSSLCSTATREADYRIEPLD